MKGHYLKLLLGSFIYLVINLVSFYKTKLSAILLATLAIIYLFILPGFSLLFRIKRFFLRLGLAVPLSIILIGLPTYLLGLIGVNIKATIFLPGVLFIIGLILEFKYGAKESNNNDSDL